MKSKLCYQCRKTKTLDQFYNSCLNKDGLQNMCKECSLDNNRKYRKKHPDYYWGNENSYFRRKYQEKVVDYQNERSKATDNCSIIKVETEDGIWLAATRRRPSLFINSKKQEWNINQRHTDKFKSNFQRYLCSKEKKIAFKILDNYQVIKQFKGTMKDAYAQRILIQNELKSKGVKVF